MSSTTPPLTRVTNLVILIEQSHKGNVAIFGQLTFYLKFETANERPLPNGWVVGAVYFFINFFLFRKANTASLNCFGFSIIMKWPTPSHIWKSSLGATSR